VVDRSSTAAIVALQRAQVPMTPTLKRRDIAVADRYIADRNMVGELVTPEYDGVPVRP
jgi:hypothetical protein